MLHDTLRYQYLRPSTLGKFLRSGPGLRSAYSATCESEANLMLKGVALPVISFLRVSALSQGHGLVLSIFMATFHAADHAQDRHVIATLPNLQQTIGCTILAFLPTTTACFPYTTPGQRSFLLGCFHKRTTLRGTPKRRRCRVLKGSRKSSVWHDRAPERLEPIWTIT